MEISLLNLRNSINKAYLKVKPNRTQIETFKKNITNLFDQIKESESEEFHKNIISEFLKNTYYSPTYYINTKGRYDLVIHNGKDSGSTVGVIFETKKPGNKAEMPTLGNINSKAFHELILYYLRERISNKNLEVKHLVITNIFDWFVFNATDFEKLFAGDKILVKQFTDFEEGRLSGTNTDFFYKNIAEPLVKKLESSITVTHFDIREFESVIKNANREDDSKLIALYKILSPEHVLKLSFANDSNNLDKTFYNELLHIIGLEETKEGGKKLIERKAENKRNQGSFIENAITILKSEDCLSRFPKLSEYGNNREEQLFNISLELAITWINRILFLKLLEGQLIKYNRGDKSFRFLNFERIHDYDELNKLFFQVLAVKESDRGESIKQKFNNIPYLNSSLLEPGDLEHKTVRINSLDDHSKLTIISGTVLKDKTGKKQTGEINPLQYLFEFLDSYDFSSEGSEDIQEENKTFINASVLGLIFEKINGYKDGSFFTPGFITMYMCHETIRRAVVQKFNDAKDWKCETISDVYNKIEDIKEANRIVNSLKICDPAVGSGHFLVSALNEIIAIKSELKILTDKEGKRLKDYTVEVINDELVITDTDDKFFEYNPKDKESQRIQETLFTEKQTIIENCLFGVDINPNSVKICRLRLWIELLKNAFYKLGTLSQELETLPNIDINIKCGNSLISRYSLDADIKTALKSSKWNVDNYREAVMTYRNAQSKDEKRSMEQLIGKIKKDFETEVSKSDKRFLKLNKFKGELLSLTGQSSLFELTKTQKDEWNKKVKKLTEEIKKYEAEIEEIKSNKIYENAFEWRFEFPEVLNNDGEFVGFDVVIGNPPYISLSKIKEVGQYFERAGFQTYTKGSDIYCLFYERGNQILKSNGLLTFITSNSWLKAIYGDFLKKYFVEQMQPLSLLNIEDIQLFEEATVESNILTLQKTPIVSSFMVCNLEKDYLFGSPLEDYFTVNRFDFKVSESSEWIISNQESTQLKQKIKLSSKLLKDFKVTINFGIKTGLNAAFIIDEDKKNELIALDPKNKEIIKPILRGRDLKMYSYEFAGFYLINSHNGLKKRNILRIDVAKNYPNILSHFENFLPQIVIRQDKGDHWSNLRNCAYLEDFEKPKIIWGEISDKPKFAFDDNNYYPEATTFLMTGEKLKFLLAILNSKVSAWYFNQISTTTGMGTNRWKKYKIELLPIKVPTEQEEKKIENLVDKILLANKSNPLADTSHLEADIDRQVYELYGLTEEEIKIIEK